MKAKLLLAGICMMLCGIVMPSVTVSAQEMEERTGYITDEEFRGILEEEISNLISARASAYPVNWEVPGKTRYATPYFYQEEGSKVIVNVELSKSCMVGLLGFSGVVRYVEGETVSHTFKDIEKGYYKFFVHNKNKGSVTVKGYYYR